ncbi:MAG TPA: HNH endonuclease [Flavobacterium sp.]|nr:HNH endonuclease [Flavobacterium sp.]
MADDFSRLMQHRAYQAPESAFAKSPFGQHWEKNLPAWALPVFGNARILDKRRLVIADLSGKVSHSQADSYSRLLSSGTSNIVFRVFAHPDGNEVLNAYESNDPEKQPKDNEVIVFFETDDGQFDFGRIVRVKLGASVVNYIRHHYEKEVAEAFLKTPWQQNASPFYIMARTDVEDDPAGISKLLVNAIEHEYAKQKFDDMSWWLLIFNGIDSISVALEDAAFDLSAWIRGRKWTEEKYWNGSLPDDKYSPPFIPDVLVIQDPNLRRRRVIESIDAFFSIIERELGERLKGDDPVHTYLRSQCFRILEQYRKQVTEHAKYIAAIYIPEGLFLTYLKHFNAFYLGLWNGIFELVAGIVDLVGLILILQRKGAFAAARDTYIALKEHFENFFNALFLHFQETLSKIGDWLEKVFDDFSNWYNTKEGKSYQILKEVGEVIPEVLSWIIPELEAAKLARAERLTATVAKATEKAKVAESLAGMSRLEREAKAAELKEAVESGEASKRMEEAVKAVDKALVESEGSALKRIDEVAEKNNIRISVPKNTLSEAQSFARLNDIYKELLRGRKAFNPEKEALKELNIKLPRSKAGLSVDFEGSPYLYPVKGTERNIVKIKLTGSRRLDNKLAQELSGVKKNKAYIWHHLDDYDPITNTCTMQLVEVGIHEKTFPHYGAVEIVKRYFNLNKY